MDQYKLEAEKGSGAFSVVFMAQSLKTNNHVAIKCMKKKFQSIEKVKKLKQIQALNILANHQNIIKLLEYLYDQHTGKLALVFQLMQMNMYECLKNKKKPLTIEKIKYYMFQVMKAIQYMHRKGIFHRDIKPQNILVTDDVVKVADLGSCKGKYSTAPYTEYISTRWYRPPQCLMTDGYYNQKMDIWSFGCVLFELITKVPLFPGKDQIDQVHRIHHIFGTPKPQILQKFKSKASHMQFNFPPKKGIGLQRLLPANSTPDLKDLLYKLLAYDYNERITAEQALKHEFFSQHLLLQVKNPFLTTFSNTRNHQKSQEKDNQSVKIRTIGKKVGNNTKIKKQIQSKNYFEKEQNNNGILPRLPNVLIVPSNNENKKTTFYHKKGSNQLEFGVLQGKKVF